MLEYKRIDISEGIDVNKTNLSKECDICHGCHDLMQKAMGFNNIAVVYIKGSAYRIHFWHMKKDYVINIMTGSNLVDKRGIS